MMQARGLGAVVVRIGRLCGIGRRERIGRVGQARCSRTRAATVWSERQEFLRASALARQISWALTGLLSGLLSRLGQRVQLPILVQVNRALSRLLTLTWLRFLSLTLTRIRSEWNQFSRIVWVGLLGLIGLRVLHLNRAGFAREST